MINTKKEDYTGYSDAGINKAVENALQKVGEQAHTRFEIIETRGSMISGSQVQYQVTITAFFD